MRRSDPQARELPPHARRRALCSVKCCEQVELPPHTRRRDSVLTTDKPALGITSAYAEKSGCFPYSPLVGGNYLRIRGEEFLNSHSEGWKTELPPHTRRRARTADSAVPSTGITSAYAEKSNRPVWLPMRNWNYLRIRGEETKWSVQTGIDGELPPHTRRRG